MVLSGDILFAMPGWGKCFEFTLQFAVNYQNLVQLRFCGKRSLFPFKLPRNVRIARLHVTFRWSELKIAPLCEVYEVIPVNGVIAVNKGSDLFLWNWAKLFKVFTGFIISLYFSTIYFTFSTWTYLVNCNLIKSTRETSTSSGFLLGDLREEHRSLRKGRRGGRTTAQYEIEQPKMYRSVGTGEGAHYLSCFRVRCL